MYTNYHAQFFFPFLLNEIQPIQGLCVLQDHVEHVPDDTVSIRCGFGLSRPSPRVASISVAGADDSGGSSAESSDAASLLSLRLSTLFSLHPRVFQLSHRGET